MTADPQPLSMLNQFSSESAQNRPIGTGAIYSGPSAPVTLDIKAQANRVVINPVCPFGAANATATMSDPMTTITWNGRGAGDGMKGTPRTLRVPPGQPPQWQQSFANSNLDMSFTLLDPDGVTIHEFYEWNPNAKTARAYRTYQLSGLGHGTVRGQRIGVSASGSTRFLGCLRAIDVTTVGRQIRHSHALSVFLRSTHPAPRWLSLGIQAPATNGDGHASTAPLDNDGRMPYGSLIALPPVNRGGTPISEMGLTTEAGPRFAASFRDYGLYLIDGAGAIAFAAAEDIPNASALRDDFRKIFQHLRLVENSAQGSTATVVKASSYTTTGNVGTMTGSDGKNWPAGGGTPLAPNSGFDAEGGSVPPPTGSQVPTIMGVVAREIVAT